MYCYFLFIFFFFFTKTKIFPRAISTLDKI